MEEKIIKKVDEKIKNIIDGDITTSNLDHLYKLSKIKKIAKESEDMNYSNYNGRNVGYDTYGRDNYGRYNNYNARGYDRKYRGHDHLERMEDEYSRYSENREKYGASQDTDRSFYYMVEALKDFIKVIEQEADSQQQKQMLRDALQQSMM